MLMNLKFNTTNRHIRLISILRAEKKGKMETGRNGVRGAEQRKGEDS